MNSVLNDDDIKRIKREVWVKSKAEPNQNLNLIHLFDIALQHMHKNSIMAHGT